MWDIEPRASCMQHSINEPPPWPDIAVFMQLTPWWTYVEHGHARVSGHACLKGYREGTGVRVGEEAHKRCSNLQCVCVGGFVYLWYQHLGRLL